MSQRGKMALVGVAESDLEEVGPGFTPLDLIGQTTLRALEDVGLAKSQWPVWDRRVSMWRCSTTRLP
jgi:hypothetical protein